MKRFTVELPDEYDDAVSITAVGQTMGVAHVRTNVTVQAADLTGHDGETFVIKPHESPEWKKPETGWIPVTERLPYDSTTVILCTTSEIVGTGYYNKDSKKWVYDSTYGGMEVDVTHWMPKPKPPEV